MTYNETKFLFNTYFYSGRNFGKPQEDRFPFGETYKNETFIKVEIRINLLNPKIADPDLVVKYKACLDSLPEVFISVGRLLMDGSVCRFQNNYIKIVDGNHRAQAHKEMNKDTILVIMPESHWRALNDCKN